MEELITVPCGLVAAACAIVAEAKPDSKVLTELRRYTLGDLHAVSRVPDGYVVVPSWKGYALLGDPERSGGYVLEHSAPPMDSELGAELIIRPATEKDREGGRKVGESRDTDGSPIQPETMAIRIGFLNEAGLDALEQQLRYLREENFPASAGNGGVGTSVSDGAKESS